MLRRNTIRTGRIREDIREQVESLFKQFSKTEEFIGKIPMHNEEILWPVGKFKVFREDKKRNPYRTHIQEPLIAPIITYDVMGKTLDVRTSIYMLKNVEAEIFLGYGYVIIEIRKEGGIHYSFPPLNLASYIFLSINQKAINPIIHEYLAKHTPSPSGDLLQNIEDYLAAEKHAVPVNDLPIKPTRSNKKSLAKVYSSIMMVMNEYPVKDIATVTVIYARHGGSYTPNKLWITIPLEKRDAVYTTSREGVSFLLSVVEPEKSLRQLMKAHEILRKILETARKGYTVLATLSRL